ncbi:PREDICTED: ankyrin repeat and SAM domain-containing protein 6-like, partial [Amphimedon queenslandica]|uniref:Ankyrin repeat protein n=1 Tax=Amphimedon queenslandica TaxID=400682 RepID=A0AAN0J3P3_AMPQE
MAAPFELERKNPFRTFQSVHDVHEMENRIHRPELHLIASSLQQKYYDLVVDVRQSLIHHNVDIEGIKLLIELYLKGETRNHPVLKKYLDLLQKIHDFNSLFHFLIDNHFIGYLNYNLLKRISKRIPQDVSLMNQVDNYEMKYAELLNKISCNNLVHLFDEWYDLSPNTPIGLPRISFRLGSPWLHSRFYTWVLTFDKLSWSHHAFLAQLRENCIIITYAILPCVLDDVMRDLKDPVILKKLKDHNITVIELPQEEEEDFEGKEEDPQIESTAKAEPRVGASSIIQTTSSEGKIPTTSTTTTLKGADPNVTKYTFGDNPALIVAIEKDNIDIVKLLLEKGTDPKVTEYTSGDNPALIVAIETDNIDIVKLLLEKGADPNVTEYPSGGSPALIIAIEKGNIDIVKLLLEKGADPNVTKYPSGGSPALIIAIEKGNIDIVKLLLEKGADPNVTKYTSGYNPALIVAIKKDNIYIVKLLLEKGADPKVTEYTSGDNPALIVAIEKDNIDIVKLLLEKGADPNVTKDTSGYNPALIVAIKKDNIYIVKLLLEKGADPKVTEYTSGDNPALIVAIEKDNIDIVKLLLEKGADPNVTKDTSGYNPALIVAIKKDNIYIVKLLLEKGADPKVTEYTSGYNPALIVAIEKHDFKIVEVLLEKGADPNIDFDT